MKSLCISIILSLSLLLTGCGSRDEIEKFRSFSHKLDEKDFLSFTSELRCEYDDKCLNFTLLFEGGPEGCSVTVKEPEIIAGIRANLRPGDTELQFEDMILDTGNLDSFGLSPMNALPLLVRELSAGCVETVCSEGDFDTYKLSSGEGPELCVRFSRDMIPEEAEIISEGKLRVFCRISNWQ